MNLQPLSVNWLELRGKVVSIALPFPKKYKKEEEGYALGIIDSYVGRLVKVEGDTLVLDTNIYGTDGMYKLFICNKNLVVSIIIYNEKRKVIPGGE